MLIVSWNPLCVPSILDLIKKDSDLVLVFFHAYAYLWNNLIFIANFMRANCFVILLVHALAKLQIRL